MTSLKQQVREALAGVCDRVFYQYPASFGEIPCAAWRESGNREYARADGGEYLAEVVYTVDLLERAPENWTRLPAGWTRP